MDQEPVNQEKKESTGRGHTFARHARAVFVIFHIIAVSLMAFPAPQGGLRKSAWKDPSVKNEMRMWASRFRAVGVSVHDDEFVELMWNLTKDILAVRTKILAPFTPYMSAVGARQSWRMFSAPHRFPSRLVIEIEEEKEWRTIYEGRSTEHTWMAKILDHHRMRRVAFSFGWKKRTRKWAKLSKFFARRAAADFPQATRLRVYMRKFETPSPEQLRRGIREVSPKKTQERVLSLEKFRQ